MSADATSEEVDILPLSMQGEFVFTLVEICGMSEAPLIPTAKMLELNPDVEPMMVDGLKGWAVAWLEEESGYLVETFQGHYVSIKGDNLQLFEPPSLEEGGFDVAWPPEGFPIDGFANRIARELLTKSYCVIQLSEDEERRKQSLAKARLHQDWTAVIPEFESKFMGRGTKGKISFLDGDPEEGELFVIDRMLTDLCEWIAPYTPSLGFIAGERSKALLRAPFESPKEELSMSRGKHEDDLASAADIEHLLDFAKRTRISMLHVVSSNGGVILLESKDSDHPSVELPFKGSRLLLINEEMITYSLRPAGAHLVVQAWLYREAIVGEVDAELPADLAIDLSTFDPSQVPRPPKYGASGESVDCVSLASVIPGRIHNPNQMWGALAVSGDGMIAVPDSRWDMDMYWAPDGKIERGQMYIRHFGMLPTEWNEFDNHLFGISDDDAQPMDPICRKQLEVGYECLVRGGWTMKSLENTHMVMACGSGGSDGWRTTGPEGNGTRVDQMVLFSQAVAANRAAYTFKLRGPCLTCDTACSSSLVAVAVMHSHMRPLEPGQMRSSFHGVQSRSGIAYGVSGIFHPNFSIGLCAAGMLSHKGRCFSFDTSADGFVRSEGVCAMHYQVHNKEDLAALSMLAGSNMNQDGKSASLTAPHGPSQQECIRGSLREARISPFDIHIQELHGTGTALGDPIEVGGLRATMMKQDGKIRSHPLVKTTSKSNVGHMETNAGITGMMKCTLMGMHAAAPGGLHLRHLNPHIDVNGYPVVFNPEILDQGTSTGYLGVSSFGFSGCNARGDVWCRASAGARAVIPIGLNLTPSRLQLFSKLRIPLTSGEYSTANPDTQPMQLPEGWNGFFEIGNPIKPGVKFFLSGTWNTWTTMDEMQKSPDGKYEWAFRMGDTLCEEFRIHVDYFVDHVIFPGRKYAGKDTQIFGPGSAPRGYHWKVDGRRDGAKLGTLYKVSLWWDEATKEKRVDWTMGDEELENQVGSLIPEQRHRYSVKGTWTSWAAQELRPVTGLAYMFETSMAIGPFGKEEFQFVRDYDDCQLIYPAVSTERRLKVPVRGPDDNGRNKHWIIQGDCGEKVTLRLRVREGNIVVTVISSQRGERTWKNPIASDADGFYCLRFWHSSEYVPMEHWSGSIYRGTLAMPESEDALFFHVLLDEDPNQIIYPEMYGAPSGLSAWMGPDSKGRDMFWQINELPGTPIEVFLDLQQVDRRLAITWRSLGQHLHDVR